jgi:hypothetical protein
MSWLFPRQLLSFTTCGAKEISFFEASQVVADLLRRDLWFGLTWV